MEKARNLLLIRDWARNLLLIAKQLARVAELCLLHLQCPPAALQGYLTDKKTPPRRTRQQDHASGGSSESGSFRMGEVPLYHARWLENYPSLVVGAIASF